ncbi:MAG TPA: hypothetical protein VMS93_00570 [Candidatus Saccharimonadales bacterium]|nr:hypothetical protein [Candidatus Saccharimonadales bacterium]
MIRYGTRRRVVGVLGTVLVPLLVLEGCAHVVHVARSDFSTVPDLRGRAVIHTRDGRVYEFHGVAVDSARFVGHVNVVRDVFTREGHLESEESVEEVRVPFTEVTAVEMRSTDVPSTVIASALGVVLLGMLINELAPATTPDTSGGSVGPGGNQAPRRRH